MRLLSQVPTYSRLPHVAALREGRAAARRFIAAALSQHAAVPCIEVERSFEAAPQLSALAPVTMPVPAILTIRIAEAAITAEEFIAAEPPS